ncbi:KPN_02809 family neutral zinc metallopeptidase [Leucobacter tenebrionis]|uniref:KPN_02809 family neutral zinc metallopeptidase n=1 Tax=Leucobacter tenebrionis TaxID=2873270 RepID=UPI001CA77981|nr:neutral zinc metallopeptidase [Leucobacter tenebrionis]QZY51383.1 neutral zinc metallopeptidase [Leucobacter tenebrionis]
MTFNDNARIDTGKVSKRSGARRGGIIAGGGGIVALLLVFGSQMLGVNLMPFAPVVDQLISGSSLSGERTEALPGCETGADANDDAECRMAATADSLDRYWEGQVDGYRSPADVVLYDGQTQSGCGTASSATGPFYCPSDQAIYLDVAFFDMLSGDYGASDGSLAQMYVLAHEWGHHISNLIGTLQQAGRETGPASGSVRLELQADCFAGAWVKDASTVTDDAGVPFLQPVTQQQIADAMSAAAAVGDDHIMESAGVEVNPERFTHGTSEQRQRWFQAGYRSGPAACGTFDVPASEL